MTGACVLTFHGVPERAAGDHDVPLDAFCDLLDQIAASGARVVPALEPPVEPSVVLTFDDGIADHAHAAYELARRGLRGVFFVPAGEIGAPGHLDENDLRDLRALGHVVGSHAYRHRPLAGLPRDAVAAEISFSRALLRGVVGEDVRYFAPPGGVGNPFLAAELLRQGFAASRSMRWGLYRSAAERWSVPCVPVTELTLRLGWVARAVERGELPASMRSAWVLKRAVPQRLRAPARRAMHGRVRERG